MIVVDTSALANALLFHDRRGRKARAALERDIVWTAPQLWKAELFSALRGLALGGEVSDVHAAGMVRRIPLLGIADVPINGLLSCMWQLRHAISGYDAAYVALAKARDIPLVTADGRLARAAVTHCRVELAT